MQTRGMTPDRPGSPRPDPSDHDLARARELLAAYPLIDGHNDLAWELRTRVNYDFTKLDISRPQPGLQTDIGRLRAGGVGGQFWSVFVPSSLSGGTAVTATLEQIDCAPVIFSHSSAGAICDVPRNVADDVLGQLGANGGVCMVTFVPQFVSPRRAEWKQHAMAQAEQAGVDPRDYIAGTAFLRSWAVNHQPPVVTIADVADHVDHVREVAGAAHVGIGGDYDGTLTQPEGLRDVAGYPLLIAELRRRGWAERELADLTRGNILRVLGDAEAVSRDLSARSSPSLATIEELD